MFLVIFPPEFGYSRYTSGYIHQKITCNNWEIRFIWPLNDWLEGRRYIDNTSMSPKMTVIDDWQCYLITSTGNSFFMCCDVIRPNRSQIISLKYNLRFAFEKARIFRIFYLKQWNVILNCSFTAVEWF